MGSEAFYEPLDDDRFASSPSTAGPWDPRWQHGGPPSALVARALGRLPSPRPATRLARVSVDILRPVPVAELRVRAWIEHSGRQVDLVVGSLTADGREVLRVTGWRLAVTPRSVPAVPDPAVPPALPSAPAPVAWPGARTEGYISTVEWRFTRGEPGVFGPAEVWARPRVALVAGERTSPLGQVLILADSGHGLSAALDPRRWLFVNTDLTVLLHREPAGEWLHLAAQSVIDEDGSGMAQTRLSDERGGLGSCLQTLFVTPRRAGSAY